MAHLRNAPPALIELYKKRSKVPGQLVPLLGKLLSDIRMKRAWNIIAKSLKTHEDYNKLFTSIIEAMRLARRGIINQPAKIARGDDIVKTVKKLSKLIAEPQFYRSDRHYSGELDLRVYEFFPEDVTVKHQALQLFDRPTMVEVLEQLAIRAKQWGSEHVAVKRRSRGLQGETTEEERAIKTRARLFSCHLDDHLCKVDNKFSGFETIRSIALIVYDVDFGRKSLRKVIVDHRKKRRLKNGAKLVVK